LVYLVTGRTILKGEHIYLLHPGARTRMKPEINLACGRHNVNLGLTSIKNKNSYQTYITVPSIGSKCFHKRYKLFIVGKIYSENSSV
jgi:hypothetical protein